MYRIQSGVVLECGDRCPLGGEGSMCTYVYRREPKIGVVVAGGYQEISYRLYYDFESI